MNENERSSAAPDLSALLSGLMANPAALSMLTSLLGGAAKAPPDGKEDCSKAPPLLPPVPPPKPADNRVCLLNALRPYLSRERCEMMESLLRILELMELLRKRR